MDIASKVPVINLLGQEDNVFLIILKIYYMIGLLYESFHGAIHFHTADVIITRVGKELPTLSCIFLEKNMSFF